MARATGPAIEATGIFNTSVEAAVQDPERLSLAVAESTAILKPWLLHAVTGLAPLALFIWCLALALGRTALLRAWEPELRNRGRLLAVCEALHLLAMACFVSLWYLALKWAARYALAPEAGAQTEPNLVLYCALVIIVTIGLFTLWSLVSWALVATPLAALVAEVSLARGFALSLRLRRARGQMLEVNLAMAVIKLGLIVLATVLSATPLPFESIMQGWPLVAWWVFVTLLYLAASDFFKMARLFVFLDQLRASLGIVPGPDLD